MDYALGEVGLRPREFWRMSWPEYERICRGYELRQVREWERTRQQGLWMAEFLGVKTKNNRPMKAKDLMPLPTDQPKALSADRAQSAKAFRDEIEAKALAKK